MLIQTKAGNLSTYNSQGKTIDLLPLEWYETNKRIFRKQSLGKREVAVKFLNENPALTEGDILFADETIIIAVTILPCDCLVIHPNNMFEMASVCYEIGNKHLPLFYEEDSLLIPSDMPLLKLLTAQGYNVSVEKRKLLQPLKTTVAPHSETTGSTLFSKIMKLTNPAT